MTAAAEQIESCQDLHVYATGSSVCACGMVRRWRKDRKPPGLTVFVCGPRRDHKCDSDGPILSGGDDVPTVVGRPPEGVRGYTWGSVSCSVCGRPGIDDAVWTDF